MLPMLIRLKVLNETPSRISHEFTVIRTCCFMIYPDPAH
jgi:hypothetical protein